MKKDNVVIDYINADSSIILKASIFDQVLYEAARICREIPEAETMAEDTFIDDRNYLRFNDVLGDSSLPCWTGWSNWRGSGFRWWRHIKRYALARKGRRPSPFCPTCYALCSCQVLSWQSLSPLTKFLISLFSAMWLL